MRVCTIASGSTGNCTLVLDGENSLLIDAGISAKRICLALSCFGLCPEDLSGILVTHEHSDHISGIQNLIKKHDIPIYAPRTVANHLQNSIAGAYDYISPLSVGEESRIGSFEVAPFRTPHDAPETVGYRISGSSVFGFCTDCGHITDEVVEGLSGAETAVIEANHDIRSLLDGPYPLMLKRRILSDSGHLSNDDCSRLALTLFDSGTQKLVLGHLSRQNNTPALAYGTVSAALERAGFFGAGGYLAVAPEKDILEVCGHDENKADMRR